MLFAIDRYGFFMEAGGGTVIMLSLDQYVAIKDNPGARNLQVAVMPHAPGKALIEAMTGSSL